MIKQIQADTAEAVSSIEEGTVEVEDGKNLAIKAGDSLKEIISASDLVIDAATQVAAASEEQSSVAETITRNVESIDRITSTTVENTGAIVNSSNELSQISDDLKKEISKFNIDNTQLAKY